MSEPKSDDRAAEITQLEVLADLIAERKRQDENWGSKRFMENLEWLAIILEEAGEVAKTILKHDKDGLKAELIQVSAVAIAWLEAIGNDRIMEVPLAKLRDTIREWSEAERAVTEASLAAEGVTTEQFDILLARRQMTRNALHNLARGGEA